jgi:hypothetical protein
MSNRLKIFVVMVEKIVVMVEKIVVMVENTY